MRWGWLGVNPAASASPPKVTRAEIRPPAPADLARLLRLAETHDPELATFICLSAATGARRSELVALRWSDLDLDRSVLSIDRGIVMGPAGLVEKDTKTHRARRVALDRSTGAALTAHRELVLARARLGEVAVPPDAFVFAGTCWLDSLVPGFGKPEVPSPLRCRRAAQRPSARPAPLRGHPATGGRRRREDRGRSTGTPECGDDAQRLLPLRAGSRS